MKVIALPGRNIHHHPVSRGSAFGGWEKDGGTMRPPASIEPPFDLASRTACPRAEDQAGIRAAARPDPTAVREGGSPVDWQYGCA